MDLGVTSKSSLATVRRAPHTAPLLAEGRFGARGLGGDFRGSKKGAPGNKVSQECSASLAREGCWTVQWFLVHGGKKGASEEQSGVEGMQNPGLPQCEFLPSTNIWNAVDPGQNNARGSACCCMRRRTNIRIVWSNHWWFELVVWIAGLVAKKGFPI